MTVLTIIVDGKSGYPDRGAHRQENSYVDGRSLPQKGFSWNRFTSQIFFQYSQFVGKLFVICASNSSFASCAFSISKELSFIGISIFSYLSLKLGAFVRSLKSGKSHS